MLGELGDIQATLHVEVRRAQNLAAPEGAREFKPYVRLRFNHVERETDYVPSPDPVWEEAAFEFACSNVNLSRSKLVAEVWNWHLDADHELVGRVDVPIQSLVPHEHEVPYALKDPKADTETGKLGLVLYFTQAAPRLFEVPQDNMYSELNKPEPEPEPEAKKYAFRAHAARRRAATRAVLALTGPPAPRNPLLALILLILTLVGLILIFYPRTPDVTFDVRAPLRRCAPPHVARRATDRRPRSPSFRSSTPPSGQRPMGMLTLTFTETCAPRPRALPVMPSLPLTQAAPHRPPPPCSTQGTWGTRSAASE